MASRSDTISVSGRNSASMMDPSQSAQPPARQLQGWAGNVALNVNAPLPNPPADANRCWRSLSGRQIIAIAAVSTLVIVGLVLLLLHHNSKI